MCSTRSGELAFDIRLWALRGRKVRWLLGLDPMSLNGYDGCMTSITPPWLCQEQDLHLERCIRVYPHDQDTGGFFVAVLELAVDLGDCEDAGPSRNGGADHQSTNHFRKKKSQGKSRWDSFSLSVDVSPVYLMRVRVTR